MKIYEKPENKLVKTLLIMALIINIVDKNYLKLFYIKYIKRNKFYKAKNKEDFLKIFILAHKDFINYRYNSVYNIVVDKKAQLRNKYNLNIIYANEGRLYKLKRAYCEMSKIYFIYQLYKNGTISSKYVGTNHYRRYFNFTDNIPDLDEIFKNNDVILNIPVNDIRGLRGEYCSGHICEKFDEVINIIKEIKPEYYEAAKKAIISKKIFFCNIFIMKKKDFLKYCEFVFDILFEFDRRNNFTSDKDVLKFTKKYFNNSSKYYRQSRMQGFLAERISNIFYYKNFKRIKTFQIGNYKNHYKNKIINLNKPL